MDVTTALEVVVGFVLLLGLYIYIEYYKDDGQGSTDTSKLIDIGKAEAEWPAQQAERRAREVENKASDGKGVDKGKGKERADTEEPRSVTGARARQRNTTSTSTTSTTSKATSSSSPVSTAAELRLRRLEALAAKGSDPDAARREEERAKEVKRKQAEKEKKRREDKEKRIALTLAPQDRPTTSGSRSSSSTTPTTTTSTTTTTTTTTTTIPAPTPTSTTTTTAATADTNTNSNSNSSSNGPIVTVTAQPVDSAPAPPETRPHTDLASVMRWSRGDPFNRACVPWRPTADTPRDSARPSRSQMIVCHDMRGGYTEEDKFCQGNSDIDVAYHMYNWQFVDMFVYFAHSLVTIPPPQWTNAAHTHGVKCLGTFITEHEDGARQCALLLNGDYQQTAHQMTAVALYYGFDGWLINIENNIPPTHIGKLIHFLNVLTSSMHAAIPHSTVIWYDAVTTQGQLVWQNALTPSNKPFFDACDGIFLNYAWTPKGITASAALAGDRHFAVYAGTDVHGRGTYGGGGWKSHTALKVCQEKKVSAALFANAWTYENHPKEEFLSHEDKFWALIAQVWPIRTACASLPFVTDFDRGLGSSIFDQGRPLATRLYTCLSYQSPQPSYSLSECDVLPGLYDPQRKGKIRCKDMMVGIANTMAFSGGASLKLSADVAKRHVVTVRLFRTRIPVTSGTSISYTFLPLKIGTDCPVSLVLVIDDGERVVQLTGPAATTDQGSNGDSQASPAMFAVSIQGGRKAEGSRAVREQQVRVLSAEDESTSRVWVKQGQAPANMLWYTRTYHNIGRQLGLGPQQRITDIFLTCGDLDPNGGSRDAPSTRFTAYLGNITMVDPEDGIEGGVGTGRVLSPPVTGLSCLDVSTHGRDSNTRMHGTLSWSGQDSSITRYYNVFWIREKDEIFLGRAYTPCFAFREVTVGVFRTATFCVQPVSVTCDKRPLSECTTLRVAMG